MSDQCPFLLKITFINCCIKEKYSYGIKNTKRFRDVINQNRVTRYSKRRCDSSVSNVINAAIGAHSSALANALASARVRGGFAAYSETVLMLI